MHHSFQLAIVSTRHVLDSSSDLIHMRAFAIYVKIRINELFLNLCASRSIFQFIYDHELYKLRLFDESYSMQKHEQKTSFEKILSRNEKINKFHFDHLRKYECKIYALKKQLFKKKKLTEKTHFDFFNYLHNVIFDCKIFVFDHILKSFANESIAKWWFDRLSFLQSKINVLRKLEVKRKNKFFVRH
jgi:hypothetical protein